MSLEENTIDSPENEIVTSENVDEISIANSVNNVPEKNNIPLQQRTDKKINFSQTDLSFIAGKRGSGKTNLLLFLIDTLTKLGMPLLIVDPVWDLRKALRELYGREDPRIVNIFYQDRKKFNAFLVKLIKIKWKGVIIVDESDGFFPNRKELTPIEKFFIHLGRHYGLGAILVTRRMANMHTDIASQASKMMLFKHWQRADLDYLRESGFDDITNLLLNLKKHHFLYIDTNEYFMKICNPVPKMK